MTLRQLVGLVFALASVSLSCHTWAASGVHEFQLRNGLKVLVKVDNRAPVVTSQLWYKFWMLA